MRTKEELEQALKDLDWVLSSRTLGREPRMCSEAAKGAILWALNRGYEIPTGQVMDQLRRFAQAGNRKNS